MGGADYVISRLDIESDWEGIARLLESEGWPFVRADLEVSARQPRSFGVVGRIGDQVVGFFASHHFGDVAYLDMYVIRADQRRNVALSRALWRTMQEALAARGLRSQVSHCTRSAARVLRAFRHEAGQTFRFLHREPCAGVAPRLGVPGGAVREMAPADFDRLVALDAAVFGVERVAWLRAWWRHPHARFVVHHEEDRLVASACLRPRRDNALALDACNAFSLDALAPLLAWILAAHPHRRLEAFVRCGCDLDAHLCKLGFEMPEEFAAVGPLVEYRGGLPHSLGMGQHVRSLCWI